MIVLVINNKIKNMIALINLSKVISNNLEIKWSIC